MMSSIRAPSYPLAENSWVATSRIRCRVLLAFVATPLAVVGALLRGEAAVRGLAGAAFPPLTGAAFFFVDFSRTGCPLRMILAFNKVGVATLRCVPQPIQCLKGRSSTTYRFMSSAGTSTRYIARHRLAAGPDADE